MAHPDHKLTARWDEKLEDFIFYSPHHQWDGRYLCHVLCNERRVEDVDHPGQVRVDPSFIEELERRGFDPKTLRFEISCKHGKTGERA